MMTSDLQRAKIFIGYSHNDARFLKELQTHLTPLERAGKLERWDDTTIPVGADWKEEIHRAIDVAKVAVLLVSPTFLESKFIHEVEVPRLLAAAAADAAVVMPVILSPCLFADVPYLARFQSVNSPEKTLSEMTRAQRQRVWVKLARAIELALA